MTPKLVAFDLDGTLAESKQSLSAQMGGRIHALLERMPVAVMSGAGFAQFQKQFLSGLPSQSRLDRLYLFPVNAAQCFIFVNGAWRARYDLAFSEQEKEKITLALYQALDNTGLREVPLRVWGERLEDRGAQESFSSLGQQAPIEEKKRWHDLHDKDRQNLRSTLERLIPEFAILTGGLTTIDITRRGVTKAYGVEKLSSMTGIHPGNMLYVGDALFPGGNDEVVKESGIPTHQVANVAETERVIEAILRDTEKPVAPSSSSAIYTWALTISILVALLFGAVGVSYWIPNIGIKFGAQGLPPSSNTNTQTSSLPYRDEIRVTSPSPEAILTSPLTITGEARGTWYFEASFPVRLEDSEGTVLLQHYAEAQSNWMTNEFVPFRATLTFDPPASDSGFLIIQNDNPSGEPERDKIVRIPVRFR